MYREERTTQIRAMLTHLVTERTRTNSFVIFQNPEAPQIVQFLSIDDELLCDVPLSRLTHDEVNTIKSLLPEIEHYGNHHAISYQKWFAIDDIEAAAEFVDTLFINVFKLPYITQITCELGCF